MAPIGSYSRDPAAKLDDARKALADAIQFWSDHTLDDYKVEKKAEGRAIAAERQRDIPKKQE